MFSDLFVYCTLIGGGALLIQVAMMFLGLDDFFEGAEGADASFDLDVDTPEGGEGGGFWLIEMLSIRTLTAAVTFFGLAGWIALASQLAPTIALMIAVAAGYTAMYSVYWSLKQMLKLETSGNLNIRNAVGEAAKVYIPIPAEQSAAGKVQMKLQERIVEYRAVTDDGEPLRTGDAVTVVALVADDTLLVTRTREAIEA